MSSAQALVDRLVEYRVDRISTFPGTHPATPEQTASEVLRLFHSLETGDFEVVEDSPH